MLAHQDPHCCPAGGGSRALALPGPSLPHPCRPPLGEPPAPPRHRHQDEHLHPSRSLPSLLPETPPRPAGLGQEWARPRQVRGHRCAQAARPQPAGRGPPPASVPEQGPPSHMTRLALRDFPGLRGSQGLSSPHARWLRSLPSVGAPRAGQQQKPQRDQQRGWVRPFPGPPGPLQRQDGAPRGLPSQERPRPEACPLDSWAVTAAAPAAGQGPGSSPSTSAGAMQWPLGGRGCAYRGKSLWVKHQVPRAADRASPHAPDRPTGPVPDTAQRLLWQNTAA